jgi:hypothetical protein
MRKVTFPRMRAIGGAMVLAGLLAGAVGARADQLSNQNHPDAALQQKLDLLDHGPDTPDALPNPDVDKGSFPRSWRIPGTNTSIRVYGSGTETLQYSR